MCQGDALVPCCQTAFGTGLNDIPCALKQDAWSGRTVAKPEDSHDQPEALEGRKPGTFQLVRLRLWDTV